MKPASLVFMVMVSRDDGWSSAATCARPFPYAASRRWIHSDAEIAASARLSHVIDVH
jgi:hypothetical protein